MQTHILNTQSSILNRFIAELRDKEIQTDPLRFRRNLQRIGEVFAYEISKTITGIRGPKTFRHVSIKQIREYLPALVFLKNQQYQNHH